MAELERRDAVTDALAELGRAGAAAPDDLQRGLAALQAHRRAATRARTRMVATAAVALAAAILLAVTLAPRLRGRGFEVDEGTFLVQQQRAAPGSRVDAAQWLEVGDATACLRVGARRVCGEPGARLRVLDQDRIELARGRVRVDGAMTVTTSRGALFGSDPGLDVTLHDDGAIEIGDVAVELLDGAERRVLAPGSRTDAAVTVAPVVAAAPAVASAPATTVAPASTTATAGGSKGPRAAAKAAAPTESAGELLVAAREQAGRGKLAAAAATYERLLTQHPRSSEAHAALVSLGRVQSSRGRHAAALSAYSRYLDEGGGPLAEEAHFGRIGALDALGRASERDRAIEALADAHPRSVYLTKARALAAP